MAGPLRYAFFCLFALLAAPAAAQIVAIGPQLTLEPATATVGGTISVAGARMADGDYVVRVNDGRATVTLTSVSGGTGEFQRNVKIPAMAAGSYAVELVENGRLADTASLRVVSPLGVTATPTDPRAGGSLAFSVSGLTAGTVSLYYAGKVAYGPVKTDGGTLSGKFVVPTDRPTTLPATVTLQARNFVGRLSPRVGERDLAVRRADLSPRLRVAALTPSTTTLTPRTALRVTGTVASNEATPQAGKVEHFWKGSDGRVVPMGAVTGAIRSDGSFSYDMRTPQVGTLSAQQANGSGQLMTVTTFVDENGVKQNQVVAGPSFTSSLDTDAAIDFNFTVRGSDGRQLDDVLVMLRNGPLDELYPDNQSPVFLEGAGSTARPTQFGGAQASDELLGCPDNHQRQRTDATGHAEFEFGLQIPGGGGMFVDGGVLSPGFTIVPTTRCFNGPSINDPGFCEEVDPAGIDVTFSFTAAHTGYGYTITQNNGGQSVLVEDRVTVEARIDRYNGMITTKTCRSGQCGDPRTFQRSANMTITLPKLGAQALQVGAVSFVTNNASQALAIASPPEAFRTDFKVLPDLSAYADGNTFVPPNPQPRTIAVSFLRGAGKPLRLAQYTIFKPGGGAYGPYSFPLTSATVDCDSEGGTQWLTAMLPPTLANAFRFPQPVFGGANHVYGYVRLEDEDGRFGIRPFRLSFQRAPSGSLARKMENVPGLTIDTTLAHATRVTLPNTDVPADTDIAGANSYDVPPGNNRSTAHMDLQFCLPQNADCGIYNSIESTQVQYSREPEFQPGGAVQNGVGLSGGGALGQREWEVLFDKTIPLFRWYWGVPELLSAEVFADLVLRAEYLFNAVFHPENPDASGVETGGRMGIGIIIGVDIDVLFGVLVDAGAAITGVLTGEVVAIATPSEPPCVQEALTFTMNFSGWLEIGCPIPNPFDPTCYIPNVEENYNILNEREGDGECHAPDAARKTLPRVGTDKLLDGFALRQPLATTVDTKAVPVGRVFDARRRRDANRQPAIAVDGSGHRAVAYLDDRRRLVARTGTGRALSSAALISEGYGIREVALTYFDTDRAMLVWAESSLTGAPPPRSDLASFQYLRWAVYDGTAWSRPANLTSPGFGEGGVRMARCKRLLLRADCTNDKLSLVFQRNTDRSIGGAKHIYHAMWNGTAWSVPTRVDQSGSINITPSVAYVGATPVVAWVRYDPGSTLDKLDTRRIALREMDGRSNEEIQTALPTRVAQPSIAGTSPSNLAIAFTRAEPTDAFVGTRQALHLGKRECADGSCITSGWRVRDSHGRTVYGERPVLVARPGGEVSVVFRGLAFGAVPGAADPEDNLFPDDPIGMLGTVGELLDLRSDLKSPVVHAGNLSNDGGYHGQPAATFDPVSMEVLALSSIVDTSAALGDIFKKRERELSAKVSSVDAGVQMAAADDLPDLAIESITSSATRLDAGTNVTLRITVRNRGSAWTPDADHVATLAVGWDDPRLAEAAPVTTTISALGPGQAQVRTVSLVVPGIYVSDERQSAYARLSVESPEGEMDGDDNHATLAIGGMPVPLNLTAAASPGTRIVNLGWTASADPRVAGYRIYADDDGTPRPLGSSFFAGFADLAARFGIDRTYRVSTYSARGVESELSEPVTAAPAKAILPDGLFLDGFESPLP